MRCRRVTSKLIRPELSCDDVDHARVPVLHVTVAAGEKTARITADAPFKEAPDTTHDYDQVLIAIAPAVSWSSCPRSRLTS